MKKMKRGLLVLTLFVAYLVNAQSSALFEQGKQQYKQEKYQEAINNWMKIVDAGEHSAALYFNIGNAYYKMNSIGPSIYFYEKALQLDPNDQEILNNLAFARNATVDSIEPLPQTIFAKWDSELASWLSFEGWAWVTVLSAFGFAILFLSYYFTSYSMRKRLLFAGALIFIFVLFTAFVMSFRTYDRQMNDQPAIVFAESTEVKSDPRMKGETSFMLHEGTKVQILAEDGDWYRIQIADGKDGWMLKDDLREL